jgi:hypothetical protein
MNIIVCIPGNNFSSEFLHSWTLFLGECFRRNINIILSNKYTSNVYFVRTMCLGGDLLKGTKQTPFQGNIEYDYILWIDSDITFTFDDFEKLLIMKKDVASGLYLMDGGKEYATVKKMDFEYLNNNGSFSFISKDVLTKYPKTFEVDYTGMGFMLIKKGVIEKLEYPWFEPTFFEFKSKNGFIIKDFCSEDVGFCLKLKNKNIPIYINKNVIVGHQKKIIYK